jgi:hypothetical protein
MWVVVDEPVAVGVFRGKGGGSADGAILSAINEE